MASSARANQKKLLEKEKDPIEKIEALAVRNSERSIVDPIRVGIAVTTADASSFS
jgi:hypothetical protein